MSDNKKEQKGKSLVVRRNDLVEGRYRINSIVARRILYRALAQIDPSEDRFKSCYTVKVSDVAEIPGLKMNDSYYSRVSEALVLLQSQVAEVLNSKIKKYTVHSWFHKIDYNYGKGSIDVVFHDDMKPVLLNLIRSGGFTVADEQYLAILKSPYSDRIYGLLKQYQAVGNRLISIEDLRDKLLIKKKYPVFSDFRRYVLEVAKKELSSKTDVSFEYEVLKEGKKATAIRFFITARLPSVTIGNREEVDPKARGIFQRMVKLGVKEKTARELIADYDDKRLKWHIDEYENRLKNGKAEGVGWLINGVKDDYRPQMSIFEQQEEERRSKAKKERKKREQLNEEIERFMTLTKEYNKKARTDFLRGLSQTEREKLDIEFQQKYGEQRWVMDMLKSKGAEDVRIVALYLDIVREKYPDIGMSPKEYAEKNGAKKEILEALSE